MKNYETPTMEWMELSECDILTASNGTPLLPYEWQEDDVLFTNFS